jgi:type I restriction enzyme R subunit
MREAERRGEELGLTAQEAAFYEALEVNDSAVAVLGDEELKTIAGVISKHVGYTFSPGTRFGCGSGGKLVL